MRRRQGQAPSLEEPASPSSSGEATPTPGGLEGRFGAQAGLEAEQLEGGELGQINHRLWVDWLPQLRKTSRVAGTFCQKIVSSQSVLAALRGIYERPGAVLTRRTSPSTLLRQLRGAAGQHNGQRWARLQGQGSSLEDMPVKAVLKTSPFVTHRSWNTALRGLPTVPSCSRVTPRLQAGDRQPLLTQAEQQTHSHLATQERPRERGGFPDGSVVKNSPANAGQMD